MNTCQSTAILQNNNEAFTYWSRDMTWSGWRELAFSRDHQKPGREWGASKPVGHCCLHGQMDCLYDPAA